MDFFVPLHFSFQMLSISEIHLYNYVPPPHAPDLSSSRSRDEIMPLVGPLSKGNESLRVKVVHGSVEIMTKAKQSADVDGHFSWTAMKDFELWDGESGETIELFIMSSDGKHRRQRAEAMATTRMERFRRQPEIRIDARLPLTLVEEGTAEAFDGSETYITMTACWTDDCFEPTFLQSLFCTACFTMADIDFGATILPRELLPARCRAQQRLLLKWS